MFFTPSRLNIMKYISILILLFSLIALTGCKKDKEASAAQEGIIFNPVKPYQEALPGSIITFKIRVKAPEPVTSFGIRFLLPGATEFVSLPQYPDVSETSGYTKDYVDFEYTLPPSSVAINADVKFKFIATTASKTYDAEYTVKMKSSGAQQARLYGPANYSYYRFGAMDLINLYGVRQDAAATTKDIIAYTINFPYEGVQYPLIVGFTSGNGTKFKAAVVADFNLAPSAYAARYAAINNTLEYSSATVASVTGPGTVLIAPNQYYLAKINRGGVFSYAAIWVKKIPAAVLTVTEGQTPVQQPGSETLEMEIRK